MAERVEWSVGFLSRLKGLLGREPSETLLVLVPCCDVHTWGMKHALDIAFIGYDGVVVESLRMVGPRRRVRNDRAMMVVERFSSPKRWFREGEPVLWLSLGKEVL